MVRLVTDEGPTVGIRFFGFNHSCLKEEEEEEEGEGEESVSGIHVSF